MLSYRKYFVFAILAAATDGTYGVPFKIEEVRLSKVSSEVFYFYSSIAKIIICLFCYSLVRYNDTYVENGGTDVVVSPLGIVSGILYSSTIWLSIISFEILGLALGSAIFFGICILTSALYSVLLLDEYDSLVVYWGGIFLLIAGIVGMCFIDDITVFMEKSDQQNRKNDIDSTAEERQALNNSTSDHHHQVMSHDITQLETSRMWGYFSAVLCGIVSGVCLLPYSYVGDSQKGFNYIGSMGIGFLIVAPIILLGSAHHRNEWPDMIFHHPKAIGYAFVSGAILCCSIILLVGSLGELYYGVAIPILSLSIVVSGLWGLLLFGELQDKWSIWFYSMFVVVVIVGTVLVSL